MARSGPSKKLKYLIRQNERHHAAKIAGLTARLEAREAATVAAPCPPPFAQRSLSMIGSMLRSVAVLGLAVMALVGIGTTGGYGAYYFGFIDLGDLVKAIGWLNEQTTYILSGTGITASIAAGRAAWPHVRARLASAMTSMIDQVVSQRLK